MSLNIRERLKGFGFIKRCLGTLLKPMKVIGRHQNKICYSQNGVEKAILHLGRKSEKTFFIIGHFAPKVFITSDIGFFSKKF